MGDRGWEVKADKIISSSSEAFSYIDKPKGMRQELKNAFGKVFITVAVDTANKWVHVKWNGYLTHENVKAGILAYTKAVQDAGVSCVLNDTTDIIGGWDHSMDWIVYEWAPEAARRGVKHMAMIASPESMGDTSADNFLTNNESFEVKVFDSASEARVWLRGRSLGVE